MTSLTVHEKLIFIYDSPQEKLSHTELNRYLKYDNQMKETHKLAQKHKLSHIGLARVAYKA